MAHHKRVSHLIWLINILLAVTTKNCIRFNRIRVTVTYLKFIFKFLQSTKLPVVLKPFVGSERVLVDGKTPLNSKTKKNVSSRDASLKNNAGYCEQESVTMSTV